VSLDWLQAALDELSAAGLLRSPRRVDGAVGAEAVVDGRRVVLFCSNDYLGLAAHPALRSAAINAVAKVGVGACASRLVSGNHGLHLALEEKLARFVGAESALSFTSGFVANLAVLSTLAGPGDVIYSDALNHASIVQGCRLSLARVVVYPHRDVEALARALEAPVRGEGRRLIVTDAIFSVDGDAAPLADLARLARRHGAALVVDEAHSLGVLGPGGRGLCAEAGVAPDALVGTFGKAFGCVGAFVAGSADLRRWLQSRATPYIYTTAPPPALAAVAAAALDLVAQAHDRRARLLANGARLRHALAGAGATLAAASRHHIVPTIVPGVSRALGVSAALFERGVFVQALRAPTVAAGTERLRWSPTSEHTAAHIDRAAEAFAQALADHLPPEESP
jgi:8-amino-7-oxononanoate synthase